MHVGGGLSGVACLQWVTAGNNSRAVVAFRGRGPYFEAEGHTMMLRYDIQLLLESP